MASDWLKIHQKQLKPKQSRHNHVYPAFSSPNRHDVRLANRRAPYVWFVLGFRMYLFLAPKWPGIPVFGKNLQNNSNSKSFVPKTGVFVPQTGELVPKTGAFVLKTGVFVPKTGVSVPETGLRVPQTGVFVPKTGLFVHKRGIVRL